MESTRSFARILKSKTECKEPPPPSLVPDGSKRVSLVWFKNTDLRLHDHLPLLTAHRSSDVVIHLMVIDPFWFHAKSRLLKLGKCGLARCKFVKESIYDLRRNLNRLGSQLIIRHGPSAEVLPRIIEQYGVREVHYHGEIHSEEQAIVDSVASICKKRWKQGVSRWVEFREQWGGNSLVHVLHSELTAHFGTE